MEKRTILLYTSPLILVVVAIVGLFARDYYYVQKPKQFAHDYAMQQYLDESRKLDGEIGIDSGRAVMYSKRVGTADGQTIGVDVLVDGTVKLSRISANDAILLMTADYLRRIRESREQIDLSCPRGSTCFYDEPKHTLRVCQPFIEDGSHTSESCEWYPAPTEASIFGVLQQYHGVTEGFHDSKLQDSPPCLLDSAGRCLRDVEQWKPPCNATASGTGTVANCGNGNHITVTGDIVDGHGEVQDKPCYFIDGKCK